MVDSLLPATIRLSMPAKPEYLVLGRLVLSGISRVHPIDPDVVGDLKLALTEACSNAVRHAYESGPPGRMDVVFELADASIAVEVTDDGPGFDIADLPEAGTPVAAGGELPDDLDEGGLGLEIIRAVADDSEFGGRDGKAGSKIRFVKKLE